MTTAFADLTSYLQRSRDNALRAAEIAARRAGASPDVGTLIEVEEMLIDAERAERRLAVIENRLAVGD
jgi:hypothetical protein